MTIELTPSEAWLVAQILGKVKNNMERDGEIYKEDHQNWTLVLSGEDFEKLSAIPEKLVSAVDCLIQKHSGKSY